MNEEQLEALENLMHYARAYKNGSDWQTIREWLDKQKET